MNGKEQWMLRLAILKGHQVVEVNDFELWSKWFDSTDRHVGKDQISGVVISTVFLGMGHDSDHSPLWFETMIFGGRHNGEMIRYKTYAEAWAGHIAWLNRVRREIYGDDDE